MPCYGRNPVGMIMNFCRKMWHLVGLNTNQDYTLGHLTHANFFAFFGGLCFVLASVIFVAFD